MAPVSGAELGLRRDPLTVAAATWVGVQLLLAALSLPLTRQPELAVLAALAGTALSSALLWPLRGGRTAVSTPSAVAAAVAVPLVALVNVLLVRPEAVATYALWFPGVLAPGVAALAVRGRPVLSGAAVLGTLAVFTGAVPRDGSPGWVPSTVVFASPLVLWWVGGVVVQRLVRTTRLALRGTRSTFALAAARRERTRQREAARVRRQQLLARTAVPLLEVVAAGGLPVDDDLRARMAAVEAELRAELRGRDLLDEQVRATAERARARGVCVDVVDHAPPGADAARLPQLRVLVAQAVAATADGEVTARRPPHGAALTLVHVGSPASLEAVTAAVRRVVADPAQLRDADVDVSRDEDSVVVDVVL